MDPISLLTFATLPTAPALDLFIVLVILAAAHGAFGLARRLGADRVGALLAGIAFSAALFRRSAQAPRDRFDRRVVPIGLLLLDRAFGRDDGDSGPRADRSTWRSSGSCSRFRHCAGFRSRRYLRARLWRLRALSRRRTPRVHDGAVRVDGVACGCRGCHRARRRRWGRRHAPAGETRRGLRSIQLARVGVGHALRLLAEGRVDLPSSRTSTATSPI